MATTTYTVEAQNESGEFETVGVKTKKATAAALAMATRDERGVAVRIVTGAGNVVAEIAAPKKIKMSAPYTRVVAVPTEIAETINGQRVAYKRTRVGFALLDAAKGEYTIWDLERNVSMGDVEIATTREAGRWFADEARAIRASLSNA